MGGTHEPWFWLGWVPRGPAGSLRFARAHSELHSGEVSIHPLKDRVQKRKPQRHLSEPLEGRLPAVSLQPQKRGCFLKDQLNSDTSRCVSCCLLAPAAGCSRMLEAHH